MLVVLFLVGLVSASGSIQRSTECTQVFISASLLSFFPLNFVVIFLTSRSVEFQIQPALVQNRYHPFRRDLVCVYLFKNSRADFVSKWLAYLQYLEDSDILPFPFKVHSFSVVYRM